MDFLTACLEDHEDQSVSTCLQLKTLVKIPNTLETCSETTMNQEIPLDIAGL